jgi:3',5'-cyclic-AMP phosphodiesterase
VITGDLTDFGMAREYELINERLLELKVPFITVIGNHDCLANGAKLYQDTYGPLNYSFTWNDVRFVAHNTNSREFGFNGMVPDLQWMNNQLSDTGNYQSCIFISHVPPMHDDFDPLLKTGYTTLIREAKNTILSSNGHNHVFDLYQPFHDGIWYLTTGSPSTRIFSYVTVYPYVSTGKKFNCVNVAF